MGIAITALPPKSQLAHVTGGGGGGRNVTWGVMLRYLYVFFNVTYF